MNDHYSTLQNSIQSGIQHKNKKGIYIKNGLFGSMFASLDYICKTSVLFSISFNYCQLKLFSSLDIQKSIC